MENIAPEAANGQGLGDYLGSVASGAKDERPGVIDVAWTVLEAGGGCAAPAKTFGVAEDGAPVVTQTGMQPSAGTATRHSFRGTSGNILGALASTLNGMTCREALILAPPPAGRKVWQVVTKEAAAGREGVIYRGNDHFVAHRGPALLGLDFDMKAWGPALRKKVERAPGGLMGVLASVFPAFADVAYLRRASSSAGVRNRDTGQKTEADTGAHIFLLVRNGEDIKRFIDDLDCRLVGAGFGWAFISETGLIQVRSIIDKVASIGASRLWFEGQVVLDDARLEFVPGVRDATVHNPSGHFLETSKLVLRKNPDDRHYAAWQVEARKLIEAAELTAAPIRRRYQEARAAALVAKQGISHDEAMKIAGRAVQRQDLCGAFDIQFDDGSMATVAEILSDLAAFHKKTCADPLEPAYGAGRNLAICYTDGVQPKIWSQAHGGIEYLLRIDPATYFEKIVDPTDEAITETKIATPSGAGGLFGVNDVDSDLPAPPETAPSSSRMTFETFDDVADAALAAGAKPLVRGLLDQGAMTILYGESNSGKSFVTLDLAYHVAIGRAWAELPVERGDVLYIAAEGGRGIAKRVSALRTRYGKAQGFRFLRSNVNLLRADADLGPLIDGILVLEHLPTLVIVDTLSRVMTGGEENSSVDMGNLVKHFDTIREAVGCHLLVVHHSGKNKARGARGHSLLRAATDTEIEVEKGSITVTKQRDIEKGFKASFSLEAITLGIGDDDEPVTSAIVRLLGLVDAATTANALSEAETMRREGVAHAVITAMAGKSDVAIASIHDGLVEELAARSLTCGTTARMVQKIVTEALGGDGVQIEVDGRFHRLIARKQGDRSNSPWRVIALRVPGEMADKLSGEVGNPSVFD